jgi:hypothetical protein
MAHRMSMVDWCELDTADRVDNDRSGHIPIRAQWLSIAPQEAGSPRSQGERPGAYGVITM